MPYPLIKVASLAIRQLSKPLANILKKRAKEYPFFRNKILIPPAQWFHVWETRIKMKTLGLGKKTHAVKPLTEEMAVNLGAELYGELFIFTVAALTIFAEYSRQKRNEIKQETLQESRLEILEKTIQEMDLKMEEQNVKIQELKRLFLQTHPVPEKITDSKTGVVLKVVK